MAGDGIKSHSQTTTSAVEVSEMEIARELNVYMSNAENACLWDALLGKNQVAEQVNDFPGGVRIKQEPEDTTPPSCPHSVNPYSQFSVVNNTPDLTAPLPPVQVKSEVPAPKPGPVCRRGKKATCGKETDKKERRKRQNREAAKTYREKQRMKKEKVESDYGRLISDNAAKEQEIHSLRQQVASLQKVLNDHKKCGSCQIPNYVPQPPTDPMRRESPPNYSDVTPSLTSRVPPPAIGIPDFQIVAENKERAPQVPPYTPNSEQSFGFETNIYSPETDDKCGRQEQVCSPLDGQEIDMDLIPSPASTEAFNAIESMAPQNRLLDSHDWQDVFDLMR